MLAVIGNFLYHPLPPSNNKIAASKWVTSPFCSEHNEGGNFFIISLYVTSDD